MVFSGRVGYDDIITCLDPILEGIFYVDELFAGDSKVMSRDYNIGSKGVIAGRILKFKRSHI